MKRFRVKTTYKSAKKFSYDTEATCEVDALRKLDKLVCSCQVKHFSFVSVRELR